MSLSGLPAVLPELCASPLLGPAEFTQQLCLLVRNIAQHRETRSLMLAHDCRALTAVCSALAYPNPLVAAAASTALWTILRSSHRLIAAARAPKYVAAILHARSSWRDHALAEDDPAYDRSTTELWRIAHHNLNLAAEVVGGSRLGRSSG